VIAVMPVVVVIVVARRRATLVLVVLAVAWPTSFGPYPAADRRESETQEHEGVAVPAND
jgi:hypothetical protein